MKRCGEMAYLFGKMLGAMDTRDLGVVTDAEVVDVLREVRAAWETRDETKETTKGER